MALKNIAKDPILLILEVYSLKLAIMALPKDPKPKPKKMEPINIPQIDDTKTEIVINPIATNPYWIAYNNKIEYFLRMGIKILDTIPANINKLWAYDDTTEPPKLLYFITKEILEKYINNNVIDKK